MPNAVCLSMQDHSEGRPMKVREHRKHRVKEKSSRKLSSELLALTIGVCLYLKKMNATTAVMHVPNKEAARWFASLLLDLRRQKFQLLTVPPTVQGNLRYWGSPRHLLTETPLGRVTSYTSVFTDASLMGGDVLVGTDNCTTVAYINRQGGVHFAALLVMVENLWSWASAHLHSLRALHENRGVDLMSRGGPLQDKWKLQPEVLQQIWRRFGKATVDLFASRSNTHCLRWFSLRPQGGARVCTRTMTKRAALRFSPSGANLKPDPSSSHPTVHMYGGIVVYTLPVHKVLSLGCVGFLFKVCGHCRETGPVRGGLCQVFYA
ncbi:hypothetical protein D5F01_LYC06131 [Larimichthys crocea]|uniref:Uncharacterized protein n=1 Tax=Larimichthys crocea TaxID=215358 RepID=A0A6G0IUK6_LARCR|nr:hypothetical protein D5F01_LYC06131 [Larimichthys crocea]